MGIISAFVRRRVAKGWKPEVAEFFADELTGAEQLEQYPTHWQRAQHCYDKMHRLRAKYYRRMAEFEYEALNQDDHTLKGQPDSVRRIIGQQRWAGTEEAKTLIGQEQMWSRWASLECSMAGLKRDRTAEETR